MKRTDEIGFSQPDSIFPESNDQLSLIEYGGMVEYLSKLPEVYQTDATPESEKESLKYALENLNAKLSTTNDKLSMKISKLTTMIEQIYNNNFVDEKFEATKNKLRAEFKKTGWENFNRGTERAEKKKQLLQNFKISPDFLEKSVPAPPSSGPPDQNYPKSNISISSRVQYKSK